MIAWDGHTCTASPCARCGASGRRLVTDGTTTAATSVSRCGSCGYEMNAYTVATPVALPPSNRHERRKAAKLARRL